MADKKPATNMDTKTEQPPVVINHTASIDLVTKLREGLAAIVDPNHHELEAISRATVLLRCFSQAQDFRAAAAKVQQEVDAQVAAVATEALAKLGAKAQPAPAALAA
jgi:hypothetical protein